MGYETYQKILSEAMEELGVETGISSKNTRNTYVEDCTIETDQPALIPDSYIEMTAEKIRIYKELDSIVREKELTQMAARITDRFGPMPRELENLFDVVRIRQAGEKLGFEKIIIKNGILIAFFIANPMSPYYRSAVFGRVMEKVSDTCSLFELKQNDGRLRIISRGVNSTSSALQTLKLLG
jgi:transcription-repair coupling factor (superfamily II helicase)